MMFSTCECQLYYFCNEHYTCLEKIINFSIIFYVLCYFRLHGMFYSSKNWQNLLVEQSGSRMSLDSNSWWVSKDFQWSAYTSFLLSQKAVWTDIFFHLCILKTSKSFFIFVVKDLFSVLMAFLCFLSPFKIRFNFNIYSVDLFKEPTPDLLIPLLPCISIL